VAGVAFSSSTRLAVTAESNTADHIVIVQLFSRGGKFLSTTLTTLPGYAQPVLATDGTNLYLVMIKVSDKSVVSRKYDGVAKTWGPDVVEVGPGPDECDGNCSWPNVVRHTDGRLRFLVRGPNGGEKENAVLAFQRLLS
jgi:hypothetical protein